VISLPEETYTITREQLQRIYLVSSVLAEMRTSIDILESHLDDVLGDVTGVNEMGNPDEFWVPFTEEAKQLA
jgi:hypothetical protein